MVILIACICSVSWIAHFDAKSKPPRELSELCAQLSASGGVIELLQVDEREWELTVDFPNKIDDSALSPLHDASSVTAIRILKGGVTDKGLKQLKSLPNLRLLVVRSEEVTEEGVIAIGALRSLVKLDLNQIKLTRRGLVALKRLDKLREFYLYGAYLADEEAGSLQEMKQLEWLVLPPTLTKASIQKISQALPGTRVKQMP